MDYYTVGRDPEQCDIAIFEKDGVEQISRIHMEITIASDNRTCYIVDRVSSNGTHIMRGGHWEKIEQAEVDFNTLISLGGFEITVSDILSKR